MSKLKKLMTDSARELKNPHTLTLAAIFIALKIVMDAMNIRINITPQLRIEFGWLCNAMIGMLFGPVVAMMSGAAVDMLGWLANNGGGGYFPGFTLTAILTGLVWGLVLYQKEIVWWRCLIARSFINIVFHIFLNSVWMKLYFGKSFIVADLPLRIGKNLLMLPLEVLMLLFVGKMVHKIYSQTQHSRA